MADQQTPLNPGEAPDPTRNYERSHPAKESGMGRLDNNMDATPEQQPDRQQQAVTNVSRPRQINAHEVVDDRAANSPGQEAAAGNLPPPEPTDHSMKEEEPMGWDQAPTESTDERRKRHPRTEGKGGTPDGGDVRR